MRFEKLLKEHIKEVADFPEQGVSFKDIAPILHNAELSQQVVEKLADYARGLKLDAVIGIDSRGFLFGPSMARLLNLPFVMVRKKGKLPGKVITHQYNLEYGSASLEIQKSALRVGDRVLIHDDLLATGGTAAACAELVSQLGAEVASFAFLIHLSFLPGKSILSQYQADCFYLMEYDK